MRKKKWERDMTKKNNMSERRERMIWDKRKYERDMIENKRCERERESEREYYER